MRSGQDAEQRFAAELELMLRVPYPLIFLQSAEDRIAMALLEALGQRLGAAVYTWSPVAGLCFGGAPVSSDDSRGLEAVLALIANWPDPALFVLQSPGPELLHNDVLCWLAALAEPLASRRQSLVFTGPLLDVPAALHAQATQLHHPLPARPTLDPLLEQALPGDRYPLLPRERIVAAALGLTRDQALRAFARAGLEFESNARAPDFDWEQSVLAEKRRALARDDVVQFVDADEGLGAVGGLDDLKEWLETRKSAFSAEARAFGLPPPRGLLLAGIQGCGKSLVAKAVARHWGVPLLRLDPGAVFGGVHAPDAALRRALRVAEALAPAVLWVDEIEKGFAVDADAATQRVLGSLLTWLQENESEVFFVATANEVAFLPPELLRKGRFDELFFVDLPDKHARAHIFAIHLRKRGRTPRDYDLANLAGATANFSGAEIEQVVVAGLYEAFADGRELTNDDMLAVAEHSVPLYATHEDAIKKLREWGRNRARSAAADSRLVDFFDDGR